MPQHAWQLQHADCGLDSIQAAKSGFHGTDFQTVATQPKQQQHSSIDLTQKFEPEGFVRLPVSESVMIATVQAVVEVWEKFQSRFLELWNSKGSGDLYPQAIYASAGSAALKVVHRQCQMHSMFDDQLPSLSVLSSNRPSLVVIIIIISLHLKSIIIISYHHLAICTMGHLTTFPY